MFELKLDMYQGRHRGNYVLDRQLSAKENRSAT